MWPRPGTASLFRPGERGQGAGRGPPRARGPGSSTRRASTWRPILGRTARPARTARTRPCSWRCCATSLRPGPTAGCVTRCRTRCGNGWIGRTDRHATRRCRPSNALTGNPGGRTRSRRCFPSSNRPAGRTAPVPHCSRPGSPRAWRVSNTTMTGRIRANTTSRSPRTSACREAGDGHEDGRRALREGPQAVHLQGEHRRIRRLGHAPPGRRRPPPARYGTGKQGTREARQAPAPRPVPRRQGSRRLRLHERRAPRRLHARASSWDSVSSRARRTWCSTARPGAERHISRSGWA